MRAIRRRKKNWSSWQNQRLRFRARYRHADRTKDRLSGGCFRISGNTFARVIPAAANRRGYALFAQATADTIDPALELLKKNRILIALKAIVTPYNIGWTLSELYQELVKEREKIK